MAPRQAARPPIIWERCVSVRASANPGSPASPLGTKEAYPLRALIGRTQEVGVPSRLREVPIGPPWRSSPLLLAAISLPFPCR